jgi:heme-degrading monooxygenase HmoA
MIEDDEIEEIPNGPVVLIDTFLPRPGRREEFLRLQVAEAQHLHREAVRYGWRGNRIYRSHDGEAVVVVTAFDSVQGKTEWVRSETFAEHLRRLDPLLEHSLSRACEPVAGIGELDVETALQTASTSASAQLHLS